MSQKNDNDKSQADKPWDKTFEDDRMTRAIYRELKNENKTVATLR